MRGSWARPAQYVQHRRTAGAESQPPHLLLYSTLLEGFTTSASV